MMSTTQPTKYFSKILIRVSGFGHQPALNPEDRDPQTFDLHLKDSTLIFTEPGGCIFHVVDTDVSAFDEQKKISYYIKRLAKN